MTTVRTHKFFSKAEADAKSESLKHLWDLGYGVIYGPFAGDKGNGFKNYWEVQEILESGPKPKNLPVS